MKGFCTASLSVGFLSVHMRFESPSATKMFARQFAKVWSRCLLLLALSSRLLADGAPARSHPCYCRNLGHTARCEGCTRLPNNLPAGVSSLDLTENRVTKVQVATNVSPHLAAVTSLYLGGNAIDHLGSRDLRPLKNLMVLDLSDNDLVSIDEWSIASNVRLKRLILNGNRQLRLVALHSRSLEDLYLRNFGLTSFDKKLLRHLPKLRELHLEGNDELPCEPVDHDLHQYYPHLKVYCDGKTTTTKRISAATTASIETASPNRPDTKAPAHTPDFPSQTPYTVVPNVQLVLPIPIVVLIVAPVVLLVVAVFFRFCRARPGTSEHRRLHDEEPI